MRLTKTGAKWYDRIVSAGIIVSFILFAVVVVFALVFAWAIWKTAQVMSQ